MQKKTYENYPRRIILVSNVVSLAIYILWAVIIFQIGIFRFIVYILYILFLELRLLQKSCRNCWYYGKYCAFGKGKLCALMYPKGDPKKFLNREITRKDLIPESLIAIIPIIIGIILLTNGFNRRILIGIIVIIALITKGNSCVRWQLACKHCKQGELGCPAKQLFDKTKK